LPIAYVQLVVLCGRPTFTLYVPQNGGRADKYKDNLVSLE